MKIIYPANYISAITADEANSEYPVTNLQDEHPNKVWKATSKDARVSLTLLANCEAVAVFASNATTVSSTISQCYSV